MAKNTIEIDIIVNGKMQKATVDAKKLRSELDSVDSSTEKATKSTDRFQRGLKGVGQQSANSSKNFAKVAQGMQGFVAVYATLAAQIFAVSAAFNFLKQAGELQALEAGQKAYAGSTGVAMRTLAKDIQAATDAQISFKDAAQAGAIGIAAGLSTQQLTDLGKAARDASQVLGRDVTDSFNRLVRGVTKAEPELLDELGIILRLKDATEAYAISIGKDVNALTQFEKSQAVANDVLTQAEEKYGRIIDIVGNSANPAAQLAASFDELLMKVQKLAITLAGPFINVLKDAPIVGITAFGLFLSGPLKAMGLGFTGVTEGVKKYAEESKLAYEKIKEKSKVASRTLEEELEILQNLAIAQKNASPESQKSKILEKVSSGQQLSALDKANLDKALKSAEKQFEESGRVRVGIFAKADEDTLKSFRETLDNMETAQEESVSRLQKAKLKLGVLGNKVYSGLAQGAARAALGITRLVDVAGKLSVAFVLAKTAFEFLKTTDFYDKYIDKTTEAEKAQIKLREEFNKNVQALVSLKDEYEKFAQVQKEIRRSLDESGNSYVDLNSTFNTSALSITKMTKQMFSPKNIDTMRASIKNLQTEVRNVNFGKQAEADLINAFGFRGDRTDEEFLGSFDHFMGELLTKATMFGMNTLAETFDAVDLEPIQTKLSEQTTNMLATMDIGAEAFQDYFNDLKEAGVDTAGYKVFDTVGNAVIKLANAQNELAITTDTGRQNELAQIMKQQLDIIEQNQQELGNLGVALEAVSKASQAARQAYGGFMQSTLGLSQGQQARVALQQEQAAILAIQNKRVEDGVTAAKKVTDEEAERLATIEKQLKVTNQLVKLELDKKTAAANLRKESTRNYDQITSAQATVLRKEDEVAAAKQKIVDLDADADAKRAASLDQFEKITPEIQEQLNLIKAQKDAEDAKLKVLQRQAEFLKTVIAPIQENIDSEARQGKLLQGRQELLNIAQKEFNIRKQIADIETKMAADMMSEAVADKQMGFFADDERIAANANLEVAKQAAAIGKAQNEQEYQNKLAQIDLEYTLLESKRKQTAYEFKLLSAQLKEKGLDADASEAAAISSQMLAINYGTAKTAAQELAFRAKEAADYGLDKAVRDSQRAVDNLDRVRNVLQTAADSFTSSLNDAINAIFDSLSDKEMDLGETLREIARSFLDTIQKAVTDKMIVQPLLDLIMPERGSAPNNPLYVSVTNSSSFIPSIPSVPSVPSIPSMPSVTSTGTFGTILNKIKGLFTSQQPKHDICACIDTLLANSNTLPNEFDFAMRDFGVEDALSPQTTVPVIYSPKSIDGLINEIATGASDPEKGIFSKIGDTFSNLFGNFSSQGPSTFGNTEDGMQEVVTPIKPSTGLARLFESFTGNIGDILSGDAPFLQGLGNLFSDLGSDFSSIFKTFGKDFSGILGSFSRSLSGLFGGGSSGSLLGDLFSIGISALVGSFGAPTGAASLQATTGFTQGVSLTGGSFRYGGISKVPEMAVGGVLKGPDAGYPAMLHGTEAVVPLPNNRSIPVDLKNAGQQNNVTVNVSVDGNGNSQQNSQATGQQSERLGQAIAAAVQKELQNQKRSGGILNPYGVA